MEVAEQDSPITESSSLVEEPVQETTETTETVEEKEPVEEEVQEETVVLKKSEYDKIMKQSEHEQKMIAKQGTEIGLLRKERERRQAELEALQKQPIDYDGLVENTDATIKRSVQIELQQGKIAELDEKEAALKDKYLVMKVVPDYGDVVDDVVELLKEEGLPDKAIEQYKLDPFNTFHPDITINFAKRVQLKKQIAKLEAENEALKKKPSKVLDNIEKAATQKVITNKGGDVSTQAGFDPFDPELSTEERIAYWQSQKKR